LSRTGHHDSRSGARSVARKLALQAIYRLQINDGPWQDVINEFLTAEDMPKADREYFEEIIRAVAEGRVDLDTQLAAWLDRKPAELDPVEHAVLLVGTWELRSRPDVPYRVVINEAVTLTRKFGATDGHKFVNAVLDRAARELRPHEH
jgi:transcription antitermination protein NusB